MHIDQHDALVVDLAELDRSQVALAGGKGAALGELLRIDGVQVPPGRCVTTAAWRRVRAAVPGIDGALDELGRVHADDHEGLRTRSAALRAAIEAAPVPDDVAGVITAAVAALGDATPLAVRSSATAEDQPSTSFAGQHDSFLGVVGPAAALAAVRRCWASLFTERAVAYRSRHGIAHGDVQMAVVLQHLVDPVASGVLFTADPVSGHRRVVSIEAVPGLGEALVSGHAAPDVFSVRDGVVVARACAPGDAARAPTLDDAQVLALAALGRRIEAHLGPPQDVEWCRVGDTFVVVQSRPITTLFPIPEAGDDAPHVYLSVGHQQMMTDALKPLGLSLRQHTAMRPMAIAGGRQFVDVAATLVSPGGTALLDLVGRGDPLTRDALEELLARGDLLGPVPDAVPVPPAPPAGAPAPPPLPNDPGIVEELVAHTDVSLRQLEHDIAGLTGVELVDFVVADVQELRRLMAEPPSFQAVMAGMEATWWLNDQLHDWLGLVGAADALTLSAPGNVTAEMGLALLDVADVVRAHPAVAAFLRGGVDDGFLEQLPALPGGTEVQQALHGYLGRYGMRGAGEIDVTRPRWAEQPTALLPALLHDVDRFAPGEAARRVARGRAEAERTAADVLARLRLLPDGDRKAAEAAHMIERARTFNGYREFPKYGIVRRYGIYKRALLAEAARLASAGVLDDPEDVFFLTLEQLREVARTQHLDRALVQRAREEHRAFEALTPPRVLTSEGEGLNGSYRRDDVPAGALVGLAVSSGTVEGRARIIVDLAGAVLEPGDVLVTTHTDPSWSPLFVAVAGLVTEVGGLMTHGSVIAREYGLPAVVGVEGATRRIADGQRIRVHGTEGYVVLLDELSAPA